MTTTRRSNSEFLPNGISINPSIPTAGENVRIMYDGLLAKSGATDLFVRVGYGSRWEDGYDYRMTRMSTGFETTIPIHNSDSLNVCFKDCANNWDNNSGKNYTFDINQ